MKKFYSLALAAALGFGVASAESVAVSFERTGTTASSVTAKTDAEGVTAKLVSVNYDLKGTAGSVTSGILCPNVNGTASPDIKFSLSVTGLPAGAEIESIGLDIHALNGANGYQEGQDHVDRKWNVNLTVGGKAFGSLDDIDIAAGVNPGGDRHQMWEVAPANLVTTSSPMTIDIDVTKGSANEGCFFGLSEVVITYAASAVVEPENFEANFTVTYQGKPVNNAMVSLFKSGTFASYGRTDAEGKWTFTTAYNAADVNAYTYTVNPNIPGVNSVVDQPLDFSADAVQDVNVVIEPAPQNYNAYFMVYNAKTEKAVAGATIKVWANDDVITATSKDNAAALVMIMNSKENDFKYEVSADGFETLTDNMSFADGLSRNVNVYLTPVAGQVTNYVAHFSVIEKNSGKGLNGVEVSIYLPDGNSVNDETDSNGECTLTVTNPTLTEYSYSVYKKGYYEEKGTIDFEKEAEQTVKVVMSEEQKVDGWLFMANIFDETTRQPIRGAYVMIRGERYESSLGFINITLPKTEENQKVVVTFCADGFVSQEKTVDFTNAQGDQIYMEVILEKVKQLGDPFTVNFTVVDENDAPLAGASVSIPSQKQSGSTDSEGRISFTLDNDLGASEHVFAYNVMLNGYEDVTGRLNFDEATERTINEKVVLTAEATDPDWVNIGMANYTDGMFSNKTWQVAVQKHVEKEVYRLVNPYTNGNAVLGQLKVVDPSKTVYVECDASNPDEVKIIGLNSNGGVNLNVADGVGNVYLIPVEGKYGTLSGNKLTFARNSLKYYWSTYGAMVQMDAIGDVVVEFIQDGLESIKAGADGAAVIYDLQGRRVVVPSAHGIYIVNGKKVRL
ncbi:MAG: hypothetical protein K2M97_03375 [Muribaculaceae bacterium]|nr:hypothetical protein [Muribaculaceae bacterium]